jgi:hypothetical protein
MSAENRTALLSGVNAIGGIVAGGMNRRTAKNCSNAGSRFARRASFAGAGAVAVPAV